LYGIVSLFDSTDSAIVTRISFVGGLPRSASSLASGEGGNLTNMRLRPISLIYALFATVAISESAEKAIGNSEPQLEIAEDIGDGPVVTTFNGVKVPALPELDGEKFNSTVKEGYWFVKHHS
jgi:hypothetical protein